MTPTKTTTKSLTGAALAIALGSFSLQAAPLATIYRVGFGYDAPNATINSGANPDGNLSRAVANTDGTFLIRKADYVSGIESTGTSLGNDFNTKQSMITGTVDTSSFAATAALGIFNLSFKITASRANNTEANVSAVKRDGIAVAAATGTDVGIGTNNNVNDAQAEKLVVSLTHINGEQVINGMTSSFMFQTDRLRLTSWNAISGTANTDAGQFRASGAEINGVEFGGAGSGPLGNDDIFGTAANLQNTHTNQNNLIYTYASPLTAPVSVRADYSARTLNSGTGNQGGAALSTTFDSFRLRSIEYSFKRVPDAGATLGMLGLGFAALVGAQRRLRR